MNILSQQVDARQLEVFARLIIHIGRAVNLEKSEKALVHSLQYLILNLCSDYDAWVHSVSFSSETFSLLGQEKEYRVFASYTRSVRFLGIPGLVIPIRIFRIRPKDDVGATHAVLPWFICPYYQYSFIELTILLVLMLSWLKENDSEDTDEKCHRTVCRFYIGLGLKRSFIYRLFFRYEMVLPQLQHWRKAPCLWIRRHGFWHQLLLDELPVKLPSLLDTLI